MTFYRGEPAVIFSTDEISIMAAPFKLSLIGKFSFGRPSMDIIRKFFVSLGLKGSSQVSLLDQRHVIINLSLEEDYTRVWTRQTWFINGKAMRMFKWSPNFRCAEESPIVPVWISIPYLPIHYVNCKQALYSIAAAVGKPLRVDHATATGNRPSVARILIEYDISKPLLPRIWIGEGSEGFWQDIIFEKVPAFCLSCKHLGHDHNTCYISKPELRDKFISKRKTPVSKNTEGINDKGLAGLHTTALKKNDRVDLSGVDGQGVEYAKSRLVEEEIVHGVQDNSGLIIQNDTATTTQHASSSPTLVPYSGLVSGQIGPMAIVEAGTASGRENATCSRLVPCQRDGFKAAQDEATLSVNQPSLQDDIPHSAVAMTDVGVSAPGLSVNQIHAMTLAQEDATPSRSASVITLGQLAQLGPHSQQHYDEARAVQPIVECNDDTQPTYKHAGEIATQPIQQNDSQPIQEETSQPHFQPTTQLNLAQQSTAQEETVRGLDSNLGNQPNSQAQPILTLPGEELILCAADGLHSQAANKEPIAENHQAQPSIDRHHISTVAGHHEGFRVASSEQVAAVSIASLGSKDLCVKTLATSNVGLVSPQINLSQLIDQQTNGERPTSPLCPAESTAQVGITNFPNQSMALHLGREPILKFPKAKAADSSKEVAQSVHINNDQSKVDSGPTGPNNTSSSSTTNSFSFQAGQRIDFNPNPTVVVVDSLPMHKPIYISEDYITDGTVDESDSFYMPDHSHVSFNTHSSTIPDDTYYGLVSRSHSLDEREFCDEEFRIVARCGVSDSAIDNRIQTDEDGFIKVTPRKTRQYHLRPRNRRR